MSLTPTPDMVAAAVRAYYRRVDHVIGTPLYKTWLADMEPVVAAVLAEAQKQLQPTETADEPKARARRRA